MKFRTLVRTSVALGAALGLVGAAAPARAETEGAALATTVTANRETAKVGDTFTITVTVKNTGTVAAKDIRLVREGSDLIEWTSPAIIDGPHFDLAPGESKTFHRDGKVEPDAHANGYVQFWYYFAGPNIKSGVRWVYLRVPGQLGDMAVKAQDKQGQGVPGTVVAIVDEFNGINVEVGRITTDSSGIGRLKGVQVGPCTVKFIAPAGWRVVKPTTGAIRTSIKPQGSTTTAVLELTGEPPAGPDKPPAGPTQPPAVPIVPSATTSVAPSTSPAAGGAGGALPVTGSGTTTVLGVGVGVVLLGLGLFVVARRRRVRFVNN